MSRFVDDTLSEAAPAASTTKLGTDIVSGLEKAQSLTLVATLTGCAGGTLDVYVQTSFDEGVSWVDLVHFAQVSTGAAAASFALHLSRAASVVVPVSVGLDGTPLLAVNTTLGGAWGNQLRMVLKTGVGTSTTPTQTVRAIGHFTD
jgi:malate/lactate dehydrogenase